MMEGTATSKFVRAAADLDRADFVDSDSVTSRTDEAGRHHDVISVIDPNALLQDRGQQGRVLVR